MSQDLSYLRPLEVFLVHASCLSSCSVCSERSCTDFGECVDEHSHHTVIPGERERSRMRHDYDLPGRSRLLSRLADQRSLDLIESTTGDAVDLKARKPSTAALELGQLFWIKPFVLRCRKQNLLVHNRNPRASATNRPTSSPRAPAVRQMQAAESGTELQITDSGSRIGSGR